MTKKEKVYVAFVKSGGTDVMKIATENKITRQGVYALVESVRKGLPNARKVCYLNLQQECLWETKYKPWYAMIPTKSMRNPHVQMELKLMLNEMQKDKFSTAEIARRLKKDHSTIRNTLKKKVK